MKDSTAYILRRTFLRGKTVYAIVLLCLTGCSLDADISPLQIDSEIIGLSRAAPDLIYGEVVTTSQGFEFVGTFGEISERKSDLNNSGWIFEGAFYAQ